MVVFKNIGSNDLRCANCSTDIEIDGLAVLFIRAPGERDGEGSSLEGYADIECEPCGTMNVDQVYLAGQNIGVKPTCSEHNNIGCVVAGCHGVEIKSL